MDAHKNFAYSTVAVAPSPALSGLSLTVGTGDGSKFPTAPFNVTVYPASPAIPLSSNAEIARVTAVVGDVLTIVRQQESGGNRAIVVGDQIFAGVTAKTLTDIEHWTVIPLSTTGTVNNWAPGISGNTIIKLTNASLLTVTGLAAGYEGQIIRFMGLGTGQVDFPHNNGGSSAGNKFANDITSGATSMAPSAPGVTEYVYDLANGFWRLSYHVQGAPIAFTPTWAASGTAVALGNGTLVGNFLVQGRLITYDIKQVNGSTTTYGTGTYSWSLPFTTGGGTLVSSAHGWNAQDVSAGGAVYGGIASSGLFAANVVTPIITAATGAATAVGQTVPFTWAVGDFTFISGSYYTT